jgi:hypothetical protein
MPDVVEHGQVIYFSLPAIGETSTVKEVGNLGIYSVVTAVKEYRERGGKRPVYLIIDEFQQVASEGFKLLLRQARSLQLSITLANQSESDLMTKQANRLLDVVKANTQVKIYMSAEETNTIKTLEKASGVIPFVAADGRLSYTPRLTVNDIRHYSGHPDYAICWITRDSGFSAYGGDWFGLRTDFHISREEYEARENAPWPCPTASTIVAERVANGPRALTQGSTKLAIAGSEELEQGILFTVRSESPWAARLIEIFDRRHPEGRTPNVG